MTNAEMRAHGIPSNTDATGSSHFGTDGFWFSTSANSEYLPIRGGNWIFGADAGVFALFLGYPRSYVSTSFGFRAALLVN
jgi:hypothetical protein